MTQKPPMRRRPTLTFRFFPISHDEAAKRRSALGCGGDKAACYVVLCRTTHPPNEIDASLCGRSVRIEGSHGHSSSATIARPFITGGFSLASLCGSMATLHSHSRHGAITWLDRHAGLGRIRFGRSNVKSALRGTAARLPFTQVIKQSGQPDRIDSPDECAKTVVRFTSPAA